LKEEAMDHQSTIPPLELHAGLYRIDPARSKVEYAGKHMFGLGTVHAQFTVSSGEIRIAEPLPDSHVRVIIDASSFTSDLSRRDRDVKSAGLLDVATYPEIEFTSTEVRLTGDTICVQGIVLAHGAAVPVEVTATSIQTDRSTIRVHARASHLDRHAFGITGSKGLVGRFLDLDLDVLAVRD